MAENTTSPWGLPYPSGVGKVNLGATDFNELATKLNTIFNEKFLVVKTSAVEITAKAGELVEMTAAGTVNLPKAAAANTIVGVFAQKGEVTVKTTSAEKIVGGALPEAGTSITLGTGQYALFDYDGTRYVVVGGVPKGYIAGTQLGEGTVRQETGTTQSFLSWGVISGTGVVEAGSGDYTAKEASAGSIEIIWTKAKASALYSVVAMPFISEGAVTPFCRERTTTKILIEMRLAGGGFASDPFMFQVLASS